MNIFDIFVQHIGFYPIAAFVCLMLAGINIPFSEDLIIITGALVSRGDRSLLIPCLIAIYSGVIISDYVSYYIGFFTRKGTLKLKFVSALLTQKNLERMRHYLDKFGIFTFIICRFIPFGIRNMLFMTSGFLRLPLRRFSLYDIPAALISMNTLFFLVYYFGDNVKNPFSVAGIILFIFLVSLILVLIIRALTKRGYHFPLTRYGLPQVAVFPAVIAAVMAIVFFVFRPSLWLIVPETILFLVLIWTLSFFRNPRRKIISDESILLSPADGKITDISYVEESDLGKALRIGIFLSIFSVHINRAPCTVRVNSVNYKKGEFKDARSPESTKVNESNALLMTRIFEPFDSLIVRQVSGAIARHIVCKAKEDDELKQGAAFGMIKFGSRTELYIPVSGDKKHEVAVEIGDAVRAGLTPLIRYI